MRTGIATVCLSGTLKEKMQACAIAGFDGIEIFEQDLVTSSLSPEDVRKMAADLGLTLDLYQPFRDFDSVTEDLLAANLRRAEAKFRLMSRLGMDTILVCTNVATATIDDDDLRAAQLAALADLAGEHGVKVAYEALAWGKYVNDYEHAHRLVEKVNHPHLGTCLDSFHILSGTGTPRPSRTSTRTRSSSCRWPTPPSSPWTCSPGAGTTASSRARASSSSPSSWATWSAPATPGRSRSKSSTTSSASPTSNAPPLTRCAR
jgi:hypothetical protein